MFLSDILYMFIIIFAHFYLCPSVGILPLSKWCIYLNVDSYVRENMEYLSFLSTSLLYPLPHTPPSPNLSP